MATMKAMNPPQIQTSTANQADPQSEVVAGAR